MFYFNGTRKVDFSSIQKIDYNEYWRSRGFQLNKKLKERELIILNQISKGSRVIDIGCGNSLLPVALKEQGVDVKVADISDIVLTAYADYGIKSLPIDLNNPQSINLEEKFDYIIMSEVLEHLSCPEDVIDSFRKNTKKFIVTVPNSAFYRYRLHLFFCGRFFTQWVYHPSEHLRYWSHSDFLDWLASRNLKVTFIEASNGLSLLGIPLYKIWPNLFGHQICYIAEVI